ncbi:hypothetical protein PG996_003106 [Apiospora saccharicola]|uniref:Uncharacterized protein n=1 Tax=Apiospora saccharicola TaxID=335842 RepID=A0ABR1W0B1_9PEZI
MSSSPPFTWRTRGSRENLPPIERASKPFEPSKHTNQQQNTTANVTFVTVTVTATPSPPPTDIPSDRLVGVRGPPIGRTQPVCSFLQRLLPLEEEPHAWCVASVAARHTELRGAGSVQRLVRLLLPLSRSC